MSNAAPPAWVLALPLKSGEWRFLSRAWGYGPWGNSSIDAPPLALASVRVKACNATIGARSGQTQGAAAKQAAKLCKLGWARRNDDNTLTLAAWGWPGVFELDVAVEHGLVLRADDGNLSWPLTPQGETGHPPQGAPTPQGSPPTGLDPTPHREGPHTPQEPSHPPQGAQSCLSSSCPTSELEEEERTTTTTSVKPAESGVLDPPPNYPAHVQAHLARVTKTAPTTPKPPALGLDVFKAIETHDNGAWSAVVQAVTWQESCASAMDGLGLDLAHVLRLLDAWTAEASPTVQPGQPGKREIWFTWGAPGKAARAWLRRKLESTRPTLRVVGGPSAYELELEEMRR